MKNVSIAFTKYHGNGNDFIVFDLVADTDEQRYQLISANAQALCDRHRGVGGDGVIMVQKRDGQWCITVINADGSVAQNCGNGLRVAARYIKHAHDVRESAIAIMFAARAYKCKFVADEIAVNMGLCTIHNADDLLPQPFAVPFSRGHIGNDHLVFLVKNGEEDCVILLAYLQDKLKNAFDFNIGFVWLDAEKNWHSRVYERGVGFTKSCGTGAIVAASFLKTHAMATANSMKIHQPGGVLKITAKLNEVAKNFASFDIVQQGNAQEIFRGICQLV